MAGNRRSEPYRANASRAADLDAAGNHSRTRGESDVGSGQVPALAAASWKFPKPDVPEPHRVPMILEDERQLVLVLHVRRSLFVRRRTREGNVILYQDAIVHDGHSRRSLDLPGSVEARPMEDDVVRLPLAGWPISVH